MSPVYAGFGRILPEELPAARKDWEALAPFDGAVFFDPDDGLAPAFLAADLRRVRPETPVVLPLVARDRNRTALLGGARTAAAAGAFGLLLLAGRLAPENPARTVYDLDPSQLLQFLRGHGLETECWVAGRGATPAEKARLRGLAQLGAARCVVPWSREEPLPPCGVLPTVFQVDEADWGAGRLPPRGCDVVLQVSPGRGAAAARACRAAL